YFRGGPVAPAGDFNLAFAIERLERMHLLINDGRVLHAQNANINKGYGLRGNYVAARPTRYDAGVQSDSTFCVYEFCDGCELTREFEDRALAFFEVETGVSGFSPYLYTVFTHAFAGGFNRALRSVRRLHHQHRR